MGEIALSWLFLAVSATALVVQFVGLYRVLTRQPTAHLVRTVGCRVLAAVVYVALAVFSLAARDSFPVAGLAVFSATQAMWLANTVADVRLRKAKVKEATWQR